MMDPAPGRSSTMKGCPVAAFSCCARMRPYTSAEPPAAKGTMIVTARFGYASAAQAEPTSGGASPASRAPARPWPRLRRVGEIIRVSVVMACPSICLAGPRNSGHDGVGQGPEPVDRDLHHVAGHEEFRRLEPDPHARRRAGGDHVARQQGDAGGNRCDDRGD